jgi:Asparagine synthase (glutamine-hydrolyzing)
MCGIAGIFSTRGNLENTEISSMAADIQRRGPDKSAIKISENHHAAFSRLSIVDLDDRAMQPMLSANKRLQISFNGEIYNRHELKQSLKYETRSQLTTTSDTEIF